MNSEKTFRTKTGYCHILPDKIVLTRDGVVGNVAQVAVGNGISRMLFFYGGISMVLFYLALDSYKKGQIVPPVLFGLFGICLVYGILFSFNLSATPIIDRQKIKEVRLKRGIIGLARTRFEVLFEDEKGKVKKRLIILPGSLTDGQKEVEKAIEILKGEKLIGNG